MSECAKKVRVCDTGARVVRLMDTEARDMSHLYLGLAQTEWQIPGPKFGRDGKTEKPS